MDDLSRIVRAEKKIANAQAQIHQLQGKIESAEDELTALVGTSDKPTAEKTLRQYNKDIEKKQKQLNALLEKMEQALYETEA